MRISACTIVKNEAHNLPRWLESVRIYADEIIVVDTGSEDTTVSLAEAGGATVYHFAWIDDFAAAKNFALEKATGDWIAFLDADEYFSEGSAGEVGKILTQVEQQGYDGVICRLLNIDADQDNRLLSVGTQLRLFRRHKQAQYEGAIHEHLAQRWLDEHKLIYYPSLDLYHTGYSHKLAKSKSLRYLPLILAMPESSDGLKDRYLMDCYRDLAEYDKAIEHGYLALQKGLDLIGSSEAAFCADLLRLLEKAERPRAEIDKLLEHAVEKYAAAAGVHLLAGLIRWRQGKKIEAEKCLLKGVELTQRNVIAADEYRGEDFLPDAYYCLGQLAEERGDRAGALDYYLKGLEVYSFAENNFSAMYELLREQDPADKIMLLKSLYKGQAAEKWLVEQLEPWADRVYLYFAQRTGRSGGVAEYIAAGRPEAAVFFAVRKYNELSALAAAAGRAINFDPERIIGRGLLSKKYQAGSLRNISVEKEIVNKEGYGAPELVAERFKQEYFANVTAVTEKKDEKTEEKNITVKAPFVSVMIPTYNRPQLFELTLQAALSQTYDSFEVVVCDNSTDEQTADLIASKYRDEPRLRYYRNRDARTKAENFMPFEKLVKGKYLQWLMDDDIILPEKLAKMTAVLEANKDITLVTSLRGVIDETGQLTEQPYQGLLSIPGEVSRFAGAEIGRDLLTTQCNFLGEPSAVLFRREDLVNHYWQAESRGCVTISDVAMWLELLEQGDAAIFREPLSYYRRHGQQEGQQPEVILLSRLEWYALIEEYRSRGIFLTEQADYEQALGRLLGEYQAGELQVLAEEAADMWKVYVELMEAIKVQLGELA